MFGKIYGSRVSAAFGYGAQAKGRLLHLMFTIADMYEYYYVQRTYDYKCAHPQFSLKIFITAV
jgi:hypothetical protein